MDIHNILAYIIQNASASSEVIPQTLESAVASEGSAIGTLGLNWKLFLAQLVNFSIVLFVLWRWVFRPVVSAMDKRKKTIEDSLHKAEQIEISFKNSQIETAKALDQAKLESDQILKKTMAQANEIKDQTLAVAKTEAENILARGREALIREQDQAIREVRLVAADMIITATEKLLHEKIDQKKDKDLVAKILEQVKE